ncbi:motility associated factor glycosyltransferase family protein [Eubacterium oxidoreducens]|uniref:Uncharacterized conserved protein n=1 Tax=Eubacterium oxidoreducens TaxID=1732 RepID=A0A1G6BS09_EUBOX|nr:6-hydroxymethylpterin diphosphokinase MptE-like protein [Eubacterium oxidoreducens]SDB23401.1 Uncharacterized conserved protein [Eubacterium oxidoreducens]
MADNRIELLDHKVQHIITCLYQNKVEEIYESIPGMLQELQELFNELIQKGIITDPSQQEYLVSVLKKLIYCYQNTDILSLADILRADVCTLIGAHNAIEEQEYTLCDLEADAVHRVRVSPAYPAYAAKTLAQRYANLKDYSVLFIYGLGDGRAIKELIAQNNTTVSFVLLLADEKDVAFYEQADELRAFCDEHKVKVLNVAKAMQETLSMVRYMFTYQQKELVEFCIMPNYDATYPKECSAMIDLVIYYMGLLYMEDATMACFGDLIMTNTLRNIPRMLKEYNHLTLVQRVRREDVEHIPAILVSAGPSLDKNIRQLKDLEDKAFIVAVDSALKALVREGIQFHIGISSDPRKEFSVFADERMNHYPMMLTPYARPEFIDVLTGKIFFQGGIGLDYINDIVVQETHKTYRDLQTGGSVATDAFSLIRECGFKNIILMGQDLAFTGGRGHVSGFEDSEKANIEHKNSRVISIVEGNDGQDIETDVQMDSYRQWFEKEVLIAHEEDVRVINATEGGAKIHGTEIMTLKEAAGELCTRQIDFKAIIEDTESAFTQEESEKILARIKKIPDEIDAFQKDLDRAIEDYNELIHLEESKARELPQYGEVVKRIEKWNKMEKEYRLMTMIRMYSAQDEGELGDNIYTEDLTVIEIANEAKELIACYKKGAERLSDHIKSIYS